jgi:hypothetical protein
VGCSLTLADKQFAIDFIPIELKNFDVIVGMDWLAKVRAELVCFEKFVRIPLENGETLIVQGDRPGRQLRLVSAIKMRRYLEKDCVAFLAHVVERKSKSTSIQDIPVVCDHPGRVHGFNEPSMPTISRQICDRIHRRYSHLLAE